MKTRISKVVPVRANFAFVAMPMDSEDDSLADVLEAIKEGAKRCGVTAERVDDEQSNERITDRILVLIAAAEFVIADLTNAKPNVYWEAGYAHALGKTPIYVARRGTRLEFDVKDFPVLYFSNYVRLKEDLEKRLKGLISKRGANAEAEAGGSEEEQVTEFGASAIPHDAETALNYILNSPAASMDGLRNAMRMRLSDFRLFFHRLEGTGLINHEWGRRLELSDKGMNYLSAKRRKDAAPPRPRWRAPKL
jgi:hypothetical protein